MSAETHNRHAFTYRAGGLSFAWEGGPYIDVIYKGQAFEVINVWDYATGTPAIPVTRHGFVGAVKQWLSETWAQERMSYEENMLRYM